ncbi:hypothetical protein BKA80DRAFT_260505 [Phyllosticta citrichinensis]
MHMIQTFVLARSRSFPLMIGQVCLPATLADDENRQIHLHVSWETWLKVLQVSVPTEPYHWTDTSRNFGKGRSHRNDLSTTSHPWMSISASLNRRRLIVMDVPDRRLVRLHCP